MTHPHVCYKYSSFLLIIYLRIIKVNAGVYKRFRALLYVSLTSRTSLWLMSCGKFVVPKLRLIYYESSIIFNDFPVVVISLYSTNFLKKNLTLRTFRIGVHNGFASVGRVWIQQQISFFMRFLKLKLKKAHFDPHFFVISNLPFPNIYNTNV